LICTATSNPVKINLWGTGLDDETSAKKLTAYAIRNTEIRIKGEVSKNAVAKVYDIQGRLMLTKNLEEGSLNIIETPNYKTGIYLLQVNDNGLINNLNCT